MLTLKELKAMVPEAEEMDRVPGYRQLQESGHKIVVREIVGEDTEVTVYDNGLVLYRAYDRATVFPLHKCRSYSYQNGRYENLVYNRVFEEENWYLRLILEGEDRLANNQQIRDALHGVVSYNATSYEWSVLEDSKLDLQKMVINKELLEKIMEKLNKQEKYILLAYYVYGISQEEIAEVLAVTQQSISYQIKVIIGKIRKIQKEDDTAIIRIRNKKN